YDVSSPSMLPQIFIKEAAVILKSAIFEETFKPQLAAATEVVRGIGAAEFPVLHGYVCTTPKARAEVPLMSDKGDPILAHWQYGLGRAVAFTSDAKAKWAKDWLGWEKYKQFWSQVAKWSLRRIENADFNTEVSVEKGEGIINVEALDADGNFRNFLNLRTVVVNPKGERQTVQLEQTGPGHYEARFPTKEIGAYLLNLMDTKDGQLRGSQVLGASVNYSPEFSASEPNHSLLARLAEIGGGKVLQPEAPQARAFDANSPGMNPFKHDRTKTFQPRDLWEELLKWAIILFTLDVAVRRVQIDRDEWLRATVTLRRWIFFWRGVPRTPEADESLAALLARRGQMRAGKTAAGTEPRKDLFEPVKPVEPAKGKPFFAPPAQEPAKVFSPAPEAAPPKPEDKPVSTTRRLLDAKRRAQKKRE
ncbi:MAG: hypothetical protein HY300_14025, partial [Verrucomicrobia bacterium]|nr:hypothetical protein [Verrucomicrobiota bacterium]